MLFVFQSCEEGIIKLRNATANPQTPVYYIVNQILYPLVQGCETKDPKIVKVSIFHFHNIVKYKRKKKSELNFKISFIVKV